jgi:hypothetical protein
LRPRRENVIVRAEKMAIDLDVITIRNGIPHILGMDELFGKQFRENYRGVYNYLADNIKQVYSEDPKDRNRGLGVWKLDIGICDNLIDYIYEDDGYPIDSYDKDNLMDNLEQLFVLGEIFIIYE